MADTKISALTAATTPLAGTEVLPIVQSGATKKASVADLTAGRAVSAASLALTGTPLPVTSGGTGNSSWTSYGLVYASGATTLTNGSALTFDGTTLKNKNSSSGAYLVLENSDPSIGGGEAIQLQFNYTTVTSLSTNWIAISRYAGANFQFISDTNGAGGVVRFTLDAGTGNAYVETGNLILGTSGKAVKDSTGAVALAFTSLKTELSGAPYVEGRNSGSPSYGVITDNRYIGPNSATDFFKVELSDDYGTALIELCVSGRGSNGANFYFQGHRYVAVNGGSSISTTTVGTDQTSGNITFTLTWTATNTFKITFTQTQTGVNFFGVVTAILKAAGGGDNTAGTIATLTYL